MSFLSSRFIGNQFSSSEGATIKSPKRKRRDKHPKKTSPERKRWDKTKPSFTFIASAPLVISTGVSKANEAEKPIKIASLPLPVIPAPRCHACENRHPVFYNFSLFFAPELLDMIIEFFIFQIFSGCPLCIPSDNFLPLFFRLRARA